MPKAVEKAVHWFNQPDVLFKCGFTDKTTVEEERMIIESHNAFKDGDWYTVTDLDVAGMAHD